MNVTVLLNSSRWSFDGYEPGHVLHKAIEYETDSEYPLDEAFERFNIGEDALARAYRAGKNRSLSVGDVVVVDGVANTCDSFGWTPLDAVPDVDPRPWYDAARERVD